MSSSEYSSDGEYQKADQGGKTKPAKLGDLRKGDYILIKDCPCKIVDVTKSKPGKHGHAKANVTAIDIFTGKKLETSDSTGHTVTCPIVEKYEYPLVNLEDDGKIFYQEEDGNIAEDITIDPSSDIYTKISEEFHDNGQEVLVSVICALGKKAVVDFRKDGK